jgi:hypothetical protein
MAITSKGEVTATAIFPLLWIYGEGEGFGLKSIEEVETEDSKCLSISVPVDCLLST